MRCQKALSSWITRSLIRCCVAPIFAFPTFTAIAAPLLDPSPSRVYEGTVEIQIADDFERGRSTTTIFLHDRHSRELLELKLTAAQTKSIRPGQTLHVKGRRAGNVLFVEAVDGAVAILNEAVVEVAPQAARRVITLIVDITDVSGVTHSVSGECDGIDQRLADINFGSQTGQLNVDGCFQDGSFGALGFGGSVYPGSAIDVVRVAVAEPSASLAGVCNWNAWGVAADAAATAQGVNLGQYQHRMYVLPLGTNCPWAGLAFVGCGNSCRAWVKAYPDLPCGYPIAIAHELGHNVGLMHSRTDANNDGVSDCEYCDTSDVMGYAVEFWHTFNAPHKHLMGWLSPSQIIESTAGGTFRISALEMIDPPYQQAVEITSPSGKTYWLGYRAAIGYDAQLANKPNYFDGTDYLEETQVHYADESRYTYLVASLPDGNEYQEEAPGMTVTQLSHSADSALVNVKLDGVCSGQPVPVRFFPLDRAVRTGPASRVYTLQLTNNDDVSCGSVAWPLVANVPPGWSASFSDPNPVVTPGSTLNVNLTVTVPAGTQEGEYPVGVILTADADHPAVELESTMFVDATVPAATIGIPENRAQYAQNRALFASYTCSDATSYVTDCVGTVPAGNQIDTTTLGTKTFTVKATDRAVNVKSTTVSYTVVPRNAAFTLSPTSLAFGNQAINVTSPVRTFTLSNTGNVLLAINSISLTGTSPSQFTYLSNCSLPVEIGTSCTIEVRFKPTSVGAKSANVVIAGGGTAGSKTVSLSGKGVSAGVTFTVAPTTLTFGNRARNTVSPAKTVSVTNTGTVTLPITSITIAGTHPGQFARTSNCPAQVPVGSSCTVNVVFKPTSVGAKSAVLRVTPGGGASVKSVALSGTGT